MKTEIIVVLGLDADDRPRAAKFKTSEAKTARKIATAHKFKLGHPKTDDAVEAANRLVDGKVFHSGNGLIPLVSPTAYDNLLKLLDIEEVQPDVKADTKAAATLPSSAKQASLPGQADNNPWSQICVGSAVLCPNEEKGKDRSWWECTVLAVAKDGYLVKWTHYPTLKPFKVKNGLVALLPAKN